VTRRSPFMIELSTQNRGDGLESTVIAARLDLRPQVVAARPALGEWLTWL